MPTRRPRAPVIVQPPQRTFISGSPGDGDGDGDARALHITLPDGSRRSYPAGTTAGEVARSIGPGLAKVCIGAQVRDAHAQPTAGQAVGGDARLVDAHTPLQGALALQIVKAGSPAGLDMLRHSSAHVLACAVQRLFPDAQVTIGPTIADGFYYDFLRPRGFTPEDLERIAQVMQEIVSSDLPFVRQVVGREEALALFGGMGETFKCEIIADISAKAPQEPLTVYRLGDWVDLCRGPHLPTSGMLGAFKLTHTAGAYWRGDERRPQLARIYGTAFWQPAQLAAHLARIEEARRRDHRKVGRELDMLWFHPQAAAMPFFLPAGAQIYRGLVELMQRYYRALHFEEVITPQLFSPALFEQSGHAANYADNMYFCRGGDHEAALKPMNCPSHALLFGMRPRSWRELPLRLADFGRLHRFERSGATAGLTRVRSFCQDDAHLFCRTSQIAVEIGEQLAMIREIYQLFGFRMRVALSGRPARSLGSELEAGSAERGRWDGLWQRAEACLTEALTASDLAYALNPGDGAFYGPKIDFQVEDAIGRWHQLGTIQLDFGLPERFDLSYIDEAGERARPVMVHRAVLGSVERFIGLLIEHTGGDLPLWLAPVQVRVLPLNDALLPYAQEVAARLAGAGLRVRIDGRREKLGFKIRDAELGRVPVAAVVGAQEAEARAVSLRWRRGTPGAKVGLDQAVQQVLEAAALPGPSPALTARTMGRLTLSA